jgi:hypothetical protein
MQKPQPPSKIAWQPCEATLYAGLKTVLEEYGNSRRNCALNTDIKRPTTPQGANEMRDSVCTYIGSM